MIRVLFAEDMDPDATHVERLLRQSVTDFRVERVKWLSTALQCLGMKQYDVILLDLTLPDSQGIDTVRQIKAEAPNTPIVVLSGAHDTEQAVNAVRYGAQQFVVKREDLSSKELEWQVLFAIERSRKDEDAKAMMRDSLEQLISSQPPEHTRGTATPNAALVSGHLSKLEEALGAIRMHLQSNAPGQWEQVAGIFEKYHIYGLLSEVRSILRLTGRGHGAKTMSISQRALEAVRKASASDIPPPQTAAEAEELLAYAARSDDEH